MKRNSNRKICVLYVTATCNLKCKYCYIDKSPVLIKIDKILENSYKDNYYFDFMKDCFDQGSLTSMEFWGGEPTYGLYRAIPTIKQAISYFPNLRNFTFSTNLTTNTCVEDIINFIRLTEDFPQRNFSFDIQLSIDGPPNINDFNRGEGVTIKFTNNFIELLFALKQFLQKHDNVKINTFFKSTLDSDSIRKLQTKKDIIEYFQFLDRFKYIADRVVPLSLGFDFNPCIFNTATPSPHTTEDGKNFANFCKIANEINKEAEQYFYFYRDIMPFRFGEIPTLYCLKNGCQTCGTGNIILGLLPNRYISGCHNGFTELLSEYKSHAPEDEDYQIDKNLFKHNSNENIMIFNEKEYEVYERQVSCYCEESRFQIVEMSSIIKQMAELGQIDNTYKDTKEAVNAAHFIQRVTSNCLRDNYGVTGSKYLFGLGFLRLFLNGAREEILKVE